MSSIIDSLESSALKTDVPTFAAGDRVRVHFQVIEGNRRRTQVFEGIVLRRQGSGVRETFTVRKQSFGVGVERTFPLHSPKIETLEVAARGDVRRAKLYYLRGRVGKAARVAERRWGIDEKLLATPAAATEGDEPVALDSEGQPQEEVEVTDQAAETEAEGAEATETDAPEGDAAPEEAPAAEAEETPEAEAEEAPEAESDDASEADADVGEEAGEPEAEAGEDAEGGEGAADGDEPKAEEGS